ncbi:CdaR family protein [Aequorivita sp. SDUM287046]|uniref:CdaR family protein n=1 Tax=Aequorivita aurantiaca TaxID=3053356 RepID=A0ABT8DKW2_9FLAO|nr:CdaR family protein [Aequorivita aurantiaca]MDN3723878.1 CdaR family protein [Aequorivita aurantiaca]
MSKGYSKNSKNAKINRFLLFLLLATSFWILTKFSREFTSSMTAKIKYENIPETAALADNNAKEITFDLTANGFEILFYKFKQPTITVPVTKYYANDKGLFTISRSELLRMVSANFNRNLAIKNLSIEELTVHLDPIVLKRVRVAAKTDIKFKNGFKAVDSIRLIPDSITISGPSGSLKNINAIETELISINNVEKNIAETVKVVSPGNEIVSIKPNKVEFQLVVAEFSQGQFTLPVEVINLPPDMNVKMVPNAVSVTFDVSVNDFASISKDSFRVVCDYSQRNKEENFMLPYLEKKPQNVYNVVFEPKKIDFFILK